MWLPAVCLLLACYLLLTLRGYLLLANQVVQDPVVLAGNSIGGFIGASMLADYPALGRGLVLINRSVLLCMHT